MIRASLLCLLAVCACHPSEGSPAPAASATVSAAPKKSKLVGFTASIDGEPLVLDSAVAFSRGGAALHLTVSTHPLECDKMAGAGFRVEPGESLFDFTIAPVVVPKEGEVWMVTGSRLGDVSRQGELGRAEVSAYDPRKTVVASFEGLSLAFPPKSVVLDGKLSATACGILPVSERAKVRRQGDLKVELDGKALVMHGASLVGERELRLTSEPHACDKGVAGSDVGIELTLGEGSTGFSKLRVSGYSVARPLMAKQDEAGMSVRALESTARDERDVALSGEIDLGGHRLLIDGVAHAERCP